MIQLWEIKAQGFEGQWSRSHNEMTPRGLWTTCEGSRNQLTLKLYNYGWLIHEILTKWVFFWHPPSHNSLLGLSCHWKLKSRPSIVVEIAPVLGANPQTPKLLKKMAPGLRLDILMQRGARRQKQVLPLPEERTIEFKDPEWEAMYPTIYLYTLITIIIIITIGVRNKI